MRLEIAIATRSNDLVDALKKVSAEDCVSIERNITGEAIVVVSASVALARAVIGQIGRIVESGQATIRSRTIISQKGKITLEGYTADEAIRIVEALSTIEK